MGARPLFGDYQLAKVKKYDYRGMGAPQAFFSKQFQVLKDRVAGKPPLERGPTAGVELDLETVRGGYYKTLNWDSSGRPEEKRCAELGINLAGDAP